MVCKIFLPVLTALVAFVGLSLSQSPVLTMYQLGRDNPEEVVYLNESMFESEGEVRIKLISDDSKHDWRFTIAATLRQPHCEGNDGNETLVLDVLSNSTLKDYFSWNCMERSYIPRHPVNHWNDYYQDFITDLQGEVIIRLSENHWNSGGWNVVIVASIYFEGSCGNDYLNCDATHIRCPIPNSHTQLELPRSSRSGHKNKFRCIPHTNVCNGLPSCGDGVNIDEFDEICHTEELCVLILDWAFIITRSLVAVIFVLIPTVVVFLLFHRRQVALQRARLLRERMENTNLHGRRAHSIAIIEMREVRLEKNDRIVKKYANDVPPTYDDLYETKDPPPCFCQAQTLGAGAGGRDNLAFECMCNNRQAASEV